MDHKEFQEWLSGIDLPGREQRLEAEAALSGSSRESASLAAIEAAVGEDRRCPRCHAPGAVLRGRSRGLRRYRCKSPGRTFGAATGTPLSGLHHKERWLDHGDCLAEGMTIRQSAEHCGIAVNTAHRWRHRFLDAQGRGSGRESGKLTGIAGAGGAYILESRKGERGLERKPRCRGGMTVSAKLPAAGSDTLRQTTPPVVDDDIMLVSDGHRLAAMRQGNGGPP